MEIFPKAIHLEAHSRYSKLENSETYQVFEESDKDCFLYVVDILNEGIHLAGANVEIMFRKTRSPIVYLQQLGRVLSVDKAENDILIFDFVANHMNMREYTQMQKDTVQQLSFGIGDSDRQIVQHDYAMEELELLEKIHQLESSIWTPEEDALLVEYYGKRGSGINYLLTVLSNRTRSSIIGRAQILGLSEKRKKSTEELKEDIKKYYCQKNGIDTLIQMYPEYTRANITNIANRMGLSLKSTKPWTSEEDNILKENAFLSAAELMKLLPGRTKASIAGRKHLLGFANKSMHSWTEDEIEIIRKYPSLTAETLRDRYFPSLTISNINFARKKYDCRKDKNIWEKDRIERFRKVYHAGGYRAVQENEEFSDMSKSAINGAAHRYNIQSSAARPTTWTEEEKNICMEWLLIPKDQRPPRKTLCQKIPAHSLSGIKDMCRRLSEQD